VSTLFLASVWIKQFNRYVYDMVIPPGVDPTPFTPRPLDGEVESFEVCSILSSFFSYLSSFFFFYVIAVQLD
jgi:hypothetical protein